jgi:hypothetical protein
LQTTLAYAYNFVILLDTFATHGAGERVAMTYQEKGGLVLDEESP